MPTLTKLCFGDGEEQLEHVVKVSDFTADASRPDGLAAYCKHCAAARQRRWKRDNPEKVKKAKREYRNNLKRIEGRG